MSYRNREAEYHGDRRTSVTVPQRFVEAANRFDGEPAQSYGRQAPGPVRSLAGRAFPRPPEGGRATVGYGELGGIVADLAAGFRDLADEGDRVAVVLGNRTEWAQVDLALQAAGVVSVTLPPDATDEEIRTALVEQDAVGAVVEEAALDGATAALDDGFAVLADGTGHTESVPVYTLAGLRGDGADAFAPALYERWVFDRSPETTATVVYERESEAAATGDASLRGREFSHAALAAGVESAVTGGTGHPDPTAAAVEAFDRPCPRDTVFAGRHPSEPHARAAAHLAPLTVGATVAYPAPRRALVDDLREAGPDLVHVAADTPEVVVETLRERAAEGFGSGLVEWALGRETDSEDVLDRLALRRLRRTFDPVGTVLVPGHEADGADGALTQVGLDVTAYRPLPGTAIALPADGADDPASPVEPSEAVPGVEARWTEESPPELLVRGRAVFDGFPADPGATLGAFERGSWFRTGLTRGEDTDGASRPADTAERSGSTDTCPHGDEGPYDGEGDHDDLGDHDHDDDGPSDDGTARECEESPPAVEAPGVAD